MIGVMQGGEVAAASAIEVIDPPRPGTGGGW